MLEQQMATDPYHTFEYKRKQSPTQHVAPLATEPAAAVEAMPAAGAAAEVAAEAGAGDDGG